jgi:GTP diphosphokinase / guanosine-3',5'-bis(diphosphate) 3'-diphosphatase
MRTQTSNSIVDLVRAMDFAARKHVGKRRKGVDAEPYVNHLAEVALLVAQATEGTDPRLVMAALLHDTIEDTGTAREDLAQAFGEDIASLVTEVTDDKTLPRAERKRLQVETAPYKSPRAKLPKIADKISNLRGILASPPKDWDMTRKHEYFRWAKQVVHGCRGVNEWLDAEFDRAYQAGREALGLG